MTVAVDLSTEEVRVLVRHCDKLDQLHHVEAVTGRVPFEVFDLEGDMGQYEWLIRRIVEEIMGGVI